MHHAAAKRDGMTIGRMKWSHGRATTGEGLGSHQGFCSQSFFLVVEIEIWKMSNVCCTTSYMTRYTDEFIIFLQFMPYNDIIIK